MLHIFINATVALMLSLFGTSCTAPTPAANCGDTIQSPFKTKQKNYPRVKQAYLEKEDDIINLLNSKNICPNKLRLFIRAFKMDKKLEVWAKNKADSSYQLLQTYTICVLSGKEGPKRKEGDKQVPEGFYYINMFNPNSRFHLSLGLNYPNKSDLILSDKDNPGFDIFIHGDCVSIGCMPLTDDKIKELYVLCVEAVNAGQDEIPVHIFPTKMNLESLTKLYNKQANWDKLMAFWQTLKPGYDYFEKHHTLPNISVNAQGKYVVL